MEKEQYQNYFVNKTDTKFTKQVKGFGRPAFTTIDTYFLVEEATRKYGIMGQWGLKDCKWTYQTFGDTTIAILEARFFTKFGDFDISNSDKIAYTSNAGKQIVDTDIYKKITTNTIAKALSYIGFGTDVFQGAFEDTAYTNELMNDQQLCNPDSLAIIRDKLMEFNVSADVVTKHFAIRALTDLRYKDMAEAIALIQKIKGK